MHQVGQGAGRFVDIGARIGNTYLVEVDPVGLRPVQRVLDRLGVPVVSMTLTPASSAVDDLVRVLGAGIT